MDDLIGIGMSDKCTVNRSDDQFGIGMTDKWRTEMSLFRIIKTARIQAMKTKDSLKSTLLSTVLGEAETKAKMKSNRTSSEPDDSEVLAVLNSCLKNATDNLKIRPQESTQKEIDILKEFIPNQMSDEELETLLKNIKNEIVQDQVPSPKFMGPILARLKSERPGEYDPGKASGILKNLLTA